MDKEIEKKFRDLYECMFEVENRCILESKIRYAISVAMPRRGQRKVGGFNFTILGGNSSRESDLRMTPEKGIECVNDPKYMFTKENKKQALKDKEYFDKINATRKEKGIEEEEFMQDYYSIKFYGLKDRGFKQLVKQLRKRIGFDGSESTLYHYRGSM